MEAIQTELSLPDLPIIVADSQDKASLEAMASLSNVPAEAEQDPEIYEILQHPYSLNPPDERTGPDSEDLSKAAFDVRYAPGYNSANYVLQRGKSLTCLGLKQLEQYFPKFPFLN